MKFKYKSHKARGNRAKSNFQLIQICTSSFSIAISLPMLKIHGPYSRPSLPTKLSSKLILHVGTLILNDSRNNNKKSCERRCGLSRINSGHIYRRIPETYPLPNFWRIHRPIPDTSIGQFETYVHWPSGSYYWPFSRRFVTVFSNRAIFSCVFTLLLSIDFSVFKSFFWFQ